MSITQSAQRSYQASVKGAYRPGLAADLGAGGAWPIFNVVNGPVLVTELWGHVTTVIANAAVPLMNFNPTVGAGAVCAVIMLSIDTDAPGTVYIWDGSLAVAAPVPTAALGMAAALETTMAGNYLILVPGVLGFTNAVAATGIIDWYINYIPAFPGARIDPA